MTDKLLYNFLQESEIFSEHEIQTLLETAKTESIKEIVVSVLNAVKEKIENMDTTPIDRSRGDIKRLRELGSLQDAVTQLETLMERSSDIVTPELRSFLKEIVKSIMYLNQYSIQFKDAYRDNKTLLVLKYQSLVMSIFSATSYLISVMIDFSAGDIELKKNPKYEEIAPIRTLKDFNRSVEHGEFRSTIKQVTNMREHFNEVELDNDVLLEANDILNVVIDGIQGLVGNNRKLIDFAYKAAGVITLLMSLREIFYMYYRSKTKLKDVLGTVETFANANMAGVSALSKLNKFSQKFIIDAEESSKLAQRDIEGENRDIAKEIKKIPSRSLKDEPADNDSPTSNDFDLGF
jgi:hypothetical protein